jgi:hypothetical protein
MTRAHRDDDAVPGVPSACVWSSNTDLCASARHDAVARSFAGKGASISPDAAPNATARRATTPFATRGPLAANMPFARRCVVAARALDG